VAIVIVACNSVGTPLNDSSVKCLYHLHHSYLFPLHLPATQEPQKEVPYSETRIAYNLSYCADPNKCYTVHTCFWGASGSHKHNSEVRRAASATGPTTVIEGPRQRTTITRPRVVNRRRLRPVSVAWLALSLVIIGGSACCRCRRLSPLDA
jgi:hypothetical protein